ncbi:MAG: tetratricopeptide repeat protein, partial [Elusimicrobiota bacterium]|nr:tetratricopeptide repeat protein [Elusimicrobiota bacterium]
MSAPLAPPDRGWKGGKDHAAALARLDALIGREGESPDRNALRAEVRAAAGRYSQAVEDAERAVELDPGSARALAALGRALARAGRLEEALARLDAALRAAPGTPWLAAERAL